MNLTLYLIVTEWSTIDNGRKLRFARHHTYDAINAMEARRLEREHNAKTLADDLDFAADGWKPRIVATVDLPATIESAHNVRRIVYPTVARTYNPLILQPGDGSIVYALEAFDPLGSRVTRGTRGIASLMREYEGDKRVIVRWDSGGTNMIVNSRGECCAPFAMNQPPPWPKE